MTPDQALAYIRDLPRTFHEAHEQAQKDMLHAIYERIEVKGPDFRQTVMPNSDDPFAD